MQSEAERRAKTKWRLANPAKMTAARKKWELDNPGATAAAIKKWRADNPGWWRKGRGYPEPTHPKPDLCEICDGPPGKRGLHLDHCHETGKFRGWLCSRCNVGLGMFEDDVGRMEWAWLYLLATNHDE